MKKLFTLFALAASLILVKADGVVVMSLTSGAASNILSGNYIVQAITILNTSTNVNTVKFWDTGTATTNIVRVAYKQYSTYATNFSVVFTNEANVIITNTYVGTYTGPTSVSAVTNSLAYNYVIMAPGSTTVSKDVTIAATRGLTAVPAYDCQVAVTYKGNP